MKLRRKTRESKSHTVPFLALGLVIVLALVCARVYDSVQVVLNGWTADLPEITGESFQFAEDSYMYASDGTTLLAKFQLEKRDPVELDAVNDYVIQATIDVEDIRFYEHNGVDITGVIRAAINNLRGGPIEGASTITMQLVRNTALSEEANEITLERKVREAQLAMNLEKQYSKDEILTFYLNTINYGDGCYGIQAAAQNYFQVPASELTLAQAATLVGIPQSPTAYNPKEHPQACRDRRNLVLDRMLAAGDITREERDAARAEDLNLNLAPDEPSQGIYAYPYFTSFVRDELVKPDNKYHCSYDELFEGGLKIYTTLDVNMQNKADQACQDQYWNMDEGMDASLVALDPRNGYVLAMVGGNDFYADQWNIAVQGGRPSGSTFKVFTLTAAIESGISPSTILDCSSPVKLSTGQTISNFGGASYGKRTLADATAISSNTGFYRLADSLGADKIIEVAHRMGIDSELSPYPIITLGTENVTPLEMAEAYATLATNGIHRDYVIITRIEKKDGTVLYENVDTPVRVLDESVASTVTSVLRGVFEKSYATAYGAGPWNGQPVAGKTGTGVEYRDHWLVGYCPQLSCAAWIGNRDYSSTSSYLTANSLWHNFMSMALDDTEIIPFSAVTAPEYTVTEPIQDEPEQSQDEVASELSGYQAGSITEDQVLDMYLDYAMHISYQFSSDYPEGSVISMSLDSSTNTVNVVVSQGPDPATQKQQ